jgi:hypothetical protein
MNDAQVAPTVPPEEPRRRRIGLIVAVTIGVMVILVAGAFVGSSLFYDNSFSRLVEATASAEHDPIWLEFFVAQDCFIGAVVEVGDADLAFSEGLQLLDSSDLLSAHVVNSLDRFREVSVLGLHGPLVAARGAIVAHYEVWNDHLDKTIPILSTLEEEDIAVVFGLWADVVVADGEPIEQTFNNAEAAFLDAARGGEALDEVDVLFTAADVACTRGAV